MSLPVDIYVGGIRIGGAWLYGDTLTDQVSQGTLSTAPRIRRQDCDHRDATGGYAYLDYRNEHWPIEVCPSCRTILRGHRPYIESEHVPAWRLSVTDLVREKWAREWPKAGRPRRKTVPKEIAWPEAA